VTADRAGNHPAVLHDLGVGGPYAAAGLGHPADACEHDAGNAGIEVLDRELEMGRRGSRGQNRVKGQSGGGVQKRREKSTVQRPALIAVFGSGHDLDDGFVWT